MDCKRETLLCLLLVCLVEIISSQSSQSSQNHNIGQQISELDDRAHIYVHSNPQSGQDGGLDFQRSPGHCSRASNDVTTNEADGSESCDQLRGTPSRSEPVLTAPKYTKQDNGQTKNKCTNPSPSATFVTALYDIGRGDWAIFPRPYFIYQLYFKDILKLNVNMVIIVDEADKEFVWNTRRDANMTNSTHVWTKGFSELPLYRHLSKVKSVVESEEFKKDNNNVRHPEAFSPDYIILMNSKLSFLNEVAEVNPFCSSHFVWIDAGYGHGKGVLPPDGVQWIPRGLIDVKGKVTIIQLERPILYQHYSKLELFKLGARSAFIGGFFGGDAAAIKLLTTLHNDVFEDLLEEGLTHEDQMMMLMCYFRNPDYFNPVEGWWYDGYKLFH